MKKRDFLNEIKTLDIKALFLRVKTLKGELADLVLDKNMNKLKDLKAVSKKKKELARVLTVLNQKKLIESLESKRRDESKELKEKKEEVKS